MSAAHIVVIPKEGKDPALCSNYRLISLISTLIKLYAKILALQLGVFLPSLIHNDQVGFVAGNEVPDNIRWALHLIHLSARTRPGAFLLSLDAEKAFDRVNWGYLWEELGLFRVHGEFLTVRHSIVIQASVSTRKDFCRHRSRSKTRQGCSLSPLLFALLIEPLASSVRDLPDIRGEP